MSSVLRQRLKARDGKRTRFRGTFVRYGTKTNWHGYPEKTILLKDIVELESEQTVTDHLWFNLTKGFQALGELIEGNVVEFDARVTEYRKGYWGHDEWKQLENPPGWDYKLSRPTKIAKGKWLLSYP